MWKIHNNPKDVTYTTLNETIGIDSNYCEDNTFTLTRPLRNVESAFLNTLVISNFSIDTTDFHFTSKDAAFIVGEKQMVAPQTLLDLKYILVSVDIISGNQIGNVNSNITNSSGIFVMDNSFSRSTNNAMTGKSNLKIGDNSTSPDNMVLVLKNLSCKKQFIPSLSSISNFKVKLMLPDGRELKRKNETISFTDKVTTLQTITIANGITFGQDNKLITFPPANAILPIIVINTMLKFNNEHRLVTNVAGQAITIDSAFTTNPGVGDTVSFEKIRIITFNSTTNTIHLRTNEFFSALEYRIGDAIKISGTEIPFLDRVQGHIIKNLVHDNNTSQNLYNQIHISGEYNFNQGDQQPVNSFFGKNYNTLNNEFAQRKITIKNLNNNYLLTIDCDIKIQDI